MKTKVRVLVGLDIDGGYESVGYANMTEEDAWGSGAFEAAGIERFYWLEAELEVPEITTMEAKISLAEK